MSAFSTLVENADTLEKACKTCKNVRTIKTKIKYNSHTAKYSGISRFSPFMGLYMQRRNVKCCGKETYRRVGSANSLV